MRHVFYFSPHQDDELTNLGVDLCKEVSAGSAVHVVLCTDGSASGVKRMLCRGDGCRWHQGPHTYTLDIPAFVAARDAEFTESCLALGVPRENIVISPLRAPDGALSADRAEAIMRYALMGYAPEDCVIKTLAPTSAYRQNPDHTAVGTAAERLKGEYAVSLLWEFILRPADLTGFTVLRPTDAELSRIKKAAAGYRLWQPERGRYAVGYHSVADEFDDFLREPIGIRFDE